jgi:hypothetical protein
MAWTNGRAMEVRDRMSDAGERFTDVWFRDAVSDPLGQVQRIYDAIGMDFTSDARDAMTGWLAEDSRKKLAAHKYTPEEFGLSKEQIREVFAAYIARFIEPHEQK